MPSDADPARAVAGTEGLAQDSAAGTELLHYFTTSPAGARSILWQADPSQPASATGALHRRSLGQVEHAAGYAPRGASSPSGRLAWLRLPPDRRHGHPAELWLEDVLVADGALQLQTPLFVGEDLFFLRHSPGPIRSGADGHLLQRLDDFELLRIDPSGQDHVLHTEASLWLHFVGVRPSPAGSSSPTLLLQRVDDAGHHLLEFSRSGQLLARSFLGTGVVRDVRLSPVDADRISYLHRTGDTASIVGLDLATGQRSPLHRTVAADSAPLPSSDGSLLLAEGDPRGETYRVPEWERADLGVIWREHEGRELSWVLVGPSGRLRLVPPGDAAQDISLLRKPR